jgi:hypothetical protein
MDWITMNRFLLKAEYLNHIRTEYGVQPAFCPKRTAGDSQRGRSLGMITYRHLQPTHKICLYTKAIVGAFRSYLYIPFVENFL